MSGSSDIIIATDVVGRTNDKLKDIVGTFVNLLPLRIQLPFQAAYADFLQEVKECVLEAFQHQDFQFDRMAALLNPQDRTRLFNTHFSYANYLDNSVAVPELRIVPYQLDQKETSQFEFKIEVIEQNDKMNLCFIFSKELYDLETMGLFMQYYYNIITVVLENHSTSIEDIEIENPVESVRPI